MSVKEESTSQNLRFLATTWPRAFTAADGHGGTLITEAPQTTQQPLLSHPHA